MMTAVTPDALIPQRHPIRCIKPMVDRALAQLSPTFDQMYAQNGRASIPPAHLLMACLLMALYSVRNERQFCEKLEYGLLFKVQFRLGEVNWPKAGCRTLARVAVVMSYTGHGY